MFQHRTGLPGPIDPRLLKFQNDHRFEWLWDGRLDENAQLKIVSPERHLKKEIIYH